MRRSGGLAPAIALHASVNFIAACVICFLPGGGAAVRTDTSASATAVPSQPARPPALTAGFIQQLTHNCDTGSTASCLELGDHYRRGSSVPPDLLVAARFYDRACAGGAFVACNYLGLLYKEGTSFQRTWPWPCSSSRRDVQAMSRPPATASVCSTTTARVSQRTRARRGTFSRRMRA